MKKLLFTLPLITLLACSESAETAHSTEENNISEESRIETDESLIDIGTIIKGEWTGDFGGNQLSIVIKKVDGKEIQGYNIVKGNKRPITGTYEREGATVKVELKEPGDDKWDGIFYSEFKLDDIALKGTWKSNNGKLTTPFDLHKSTDDVDMKIVGNYIIEAIPYTNIVIKADRTCSLTEIDMDSMEDNPEDPKEISLKGSWHSVGDKVTIEWWGSYFGEKKTVLTYDRTEGQGGVPGQELLIFDDDWYVYKN